MNAKPETTEEQRDRFAALLIDATGERNEMRLARDLAEARLAKTSVLVDTLKMYAERVTDGIRAREALAEWERE